MGEYFRCSYTGIAKRLVIDAEIEHEGKKFNIETMWDTGCDITIINDRFVDIFNLQSVGSGKLDTISDEKIPSKIYKINLILPNNIELKDVEAIAGNPKNCDVLIGMDIISQGDFVISNYNGKTTFIFQKPSIGKFTYDPIIKNKIGRNDPCPCGSGKKYKHCCIGKK